MCGRYTVMSPDEVASDLQAAIAPGSTDSEWWKSRFNVAPTQPAPVVTLRDGVRMLELMRWGLVPHWAKPGSGKKPPLMINTRVESIEAKPMFRDALARRRCLVAANGFFEWKRAGKLALPMYFHPQRDRHVAFAGIWMRAGDITSFSIVTGPANPLVAPIHDRMPVLLDPSLYAAWLDPAVDAAGAHALLGVPDVGDWHVQQVSTWVNKADHDDPRCIEPVVEPAKAQGELF